MLEEHLKKSFKLQKQFIGNMKTMSFTYETQ